MRPKAVVAALRCSGFERAGSEGPKQPRDVPQILMRVIIHPARYRIGGKSQNQRADGMVDFGVAGNGRDARWLHIHGDIPVGNGTWFCPLFGKRRRVAVSPASQ